MYSVIIIYTASRSKQDLLFFGYIISISVGENKDVRTGGDDNFVAKYGDTQSSINICSLVEYFMLIGFAVAITILQNEDAIPGISFRELWIETQSIVGCFANPDSSSLVNADIGRVDDHRFRSK